MPQQRGIFILQQWLSLLKALRKIKVQIRIAYQGILFAGLPNRINAVNPQPEGYI
jgi:hypothetical protein